MNQSINHIPVWPTYPEGGQSAKILVLGDAPKAEDCLAARPFAGPTGRFFFSMLNKVGITRDNAVFGYVFPHKVLADDFKNMFVGKRVAAPFIKGGWEPVYSPHTMGYLPPCREYDIHNLARLIERVNPNVIIVLGAIAMWAVTGLSKIGTYRGTVLETGDHLKLSRKYKVVATYEPGKLVGGQYDARPLFLADLRKAWFNRNNSETELFKREIWINPLLSDLDVFYNEYIKPMCGGDIPVAYDIETMKMDRDGEFERCLTCIGFAPNSSVAIVVPFYSSNGGNYWYTAEQEYKAWAWVQKILEDPTLKKLAHNIAYDASWMAHELGIRTMGIIEDTMHMHHALEPELPKSLGVLGSIFTEEQAWKTLAKKASNKRDE